MRWLTRGKMAKMHEAVLGDDVIETDVACVACGYNLRGLAPSGDCPECGCAMRMSLRADRLAHAPLSWRRRLSRGALLLLTALILLPLLNAVAAAVVGWGAALPSMSVVGSGVALAAGANLAVLALTVAAMWLLSAPEPGRTEPATERRPRVGARMALAVWAPLTLGVIVAVFVTGQPMHGDWWLYDGVLIVAGAIFALGMIALWSHLAVLAQRVPAPLLMRRLHRLRWDWIVAVSGMVLVAVAMNVATLAGGRAVGAGLGGGGTGGLAAPLGGAWAAGALGTLAVLVVWLWARTTRAGWGLFRAMRATSRL